MRAEPRGRPNPSSSDLPAPYRSPWKRLGEDLQAVGADLLLRARELWRRNGEGSLWRPPFWPRSAAAVFWPLVLVAVLAGLALGLGLRRGAPPPGAAAQVEGDGPQAAPAPLPEAAEPSLTAPSIPPSTLTGEAEAQPEPQSGDLAASAPDLEPGTDLEALPVPSPPPGPEETLLEEFAAPDAAGVIVAVRPDAATAALQLEVGDGFARLEPRRRRRLAEDWAVLAAERGYERLEVVDGRGRLWARPSAVGDGLVVLGYPVAPEPR
ncbi:hypothetical protein NZK32_13120 [Cyanobium sp. FGCU-52]|nr:hypothetical protein [Cyanobium sp. FGCU52]